MTHSFATATLLLGLLVPAAASGPLRASGPSPLQAEVALLEQQLAERAGDRIPSALRPRLARTIVADARRHGFEPALVLAVIEVESAFRPGVISSAGAHGLMQIRPRTGLAWARRIGIPWQGEHVTLRDPIANVRIGIAYLAYLRDRFQSLPTGLAAYNQGPTRVSQKLGRGEPVPVRYTRRVMQAWAGPLDS